MRLFHRVRSLPAWSRALLVGLTLAFGLNSLAHTAHQHDTLVTSVVHSSTCGYCVSFGGLATAPVHALAHFGVDLDGFIVADASNPLRLFRAPSAAQPRAPPTP